MITSESRNRNSKVGDTMSDNRNMTEGMNKTQKLFYFWYYYKWFFLLAVGGIILAIAVITTVHREYEKEYLMNIVLANAETYTVNESDYLDRFLEEYDYDENVVLSIDTSIAVDTVKGGEQSAAGIQTLAALFVTGDVDLYISDEALFELEAQNHAFTDLREILPDSILEAYADLLWYGTEEDTGEEIPYGIDVSGFAICTEEAFYAAEDVPLLGVGSQYGCETEDLVNLILYLCAQ